MSGLGLFAVVARFASVTERYGMAVTVLLPLEGLERAERAAGRPKDLIDLAEILELRRQTGNESRAGV